MEFLRFKHARFAASFPKSFLYSRSHYWMAPAADGPGLWHVGFTKFSTRMLGELVEASFEVAADAPIEPGQEIGSVEGFKAASAVYSVMRGTFGEMNPVLSQDACVVKSDPYQVGWLYSARGEPEADFLSAEQYLALLHETIARLAAAEHKEGDV
ncbi:MAG: glycine cleavage system protein H [Verrucomicrobiales bacterium]